jgi:CubicO group peptidase (beta-lactamase class C family)
LILATPYLLTAADAPAPQGLPTVDPAAAGMDGEKLAGISTAMQKFVDGGQLAGAVTLVARRGHVAHLAAVGRADLESRNMTLVVARHCLLTKPITATAVMILQDEGKLSGRSVTQYIPEFAEAN